MKEKTEPILKKVALKTPREIDTEKDSEPRTSKGQIYEIMKTDKEHTETTETEQFSHSESREEDENTKIKNTCSIIKEFAEGCKKGSKNDSMDPNEGIKDEKNEELSVKSRDKKPRKKGKVISVRPSVSNGFYHGTVSLCISKKKNKRTGFLQWINKGKTPELLILNKDLFIIKHLSDNFIESKRLDKKVIDKFKMKGLKYYNQRNRRCLSFVLPLTLTDINMFTDMEIYVNRISSFDDWPKNASISSSDLAKAGFIYEGDGQKVRCFSCGLTVFDFPADFEPLNYHREKSSHCSFLQSPELKNTSGMEKNASNNSVSKRQHDGKTQRYVDNTRSRIGQHYPSDERKSKLSSDKTEGCLFKIAKGFLPLDFIIDETAEMNMPKNVLQGVEIHIQDIRHDIRYGNNSLNCNVDTYSNLSGSVFELEKNSQYRDEQNRFASFTKWSCPHIINPTCLAKAGFYYTEQGDCVRCFCCDIGLAEWKPGDDPWIEHARYSPNCLFLLKSKGGEFIKDVQARRRQINRPKHKEFEDVNARIQSFVNWPSSTGQQPDQLASAGFYYTGQEDAARCFYCGISIASWMLAVDPWIEHARFRPNCLFLLQGRGNEFIEDVHARWRQRHIYFPKNSEFEDINARIQSYVNWTSSAGQQPDQLASAGFYYTGVDDKVRCYCCNGCLYEWEEGDQPWEEHARWFPTCEFVIKMKGLAYVEEIARQGNDVTNSRHTEQPNFYS